YVPLYFFFDGGAVDADAGVVERLAVGRIAAHEKESVRCVPVRAQRKLIAYDIKLRRNRRVAEWRAGDEAEEILRVRAEIGVDGIVAVIENPPSIARRKGSLYRHADAVSQNKFPSGIEPPIGTGRIIRAASFI